ncbi:hypothetical protein M0654_02100 [Rhizobium sp. NTR19]|uniref:Uncharacterized protein n=1 Tax=Neorhizobium turbinariae TaxID=2937795 RepID=A0ABT0ILK4_9HYPH|nr:hypothetical protein [Neorhizobium turbinariae]MCK8778765.1 hypothetical protein [Neorhizobium turbinariae]
MKKLLGLDGVGLVSDRRRRSSPVVRRVFQPELKGKADSALGDLEKFDEWTGRRKLPR